MIRRHDHKDTWDPREALSLLSTKSIPKRALATIVRERYGSQIEAARALDVTYDQLCRWLRGNRRMSNRDVVEVAHKLQVSPLLILDLPEDEASTYTNGRAKPAVSKRDEDRTAPAAATRALLVQSVRRTANDRNELLTPASMWETPLGDYRDLRQLAADMASYYCEVWPEDDLDALAQDMAARIGNQLE